MTARMINSLSTLNLWGICCCSSWIPENLWGLTGIHPRILKELFHVIAKLLSMIFVWSWEYGEVPADWKLVNIVPVFKKSTKEDPGNYTPVSLTSVPGKVMEKIILGNIEKHLKDNAVFGHSQHSFMRGKSCLSNLISYHDKVTHLVDQGKPVDVIVWISVKLLILSLKESFWTKCPAHSWINTSVVGEQLAHESSTEGNSKWGDIRVVTCH
ncbi:rna-directed dna polymerase from mobile element jockey-like [Pitangus sulphuratus]|nr:rna-directed dna polymerase from mobile element jockey-like [Pitangus sulphuratus]